MAAHGNRSLNQAKEGFFRELYQNLRLIIRLMGDGRVNMFLKLLPIGVLLYWVVPADIFPVNPMDDALVIWLGCAVFIELCPKDVVEEHQRDLRGQGGAGRASEEAVDGTYKDVA